MTINYIIKLATQNKGIKYYGLWNLRKKMWLMDRDGFAAKLFTSVPKAQDYAIKNGLK